MAELSTRDSFIIRVYRYDTEDARKVAGLIEVLDGSGDSESFADTDELGAILGTFLSSGKHRRKRLKKGERHES